MDNMEVSSITEKKNLFGCHHDFFKNSGFIIFTSSNLIYQWFELLIPDANNITRKLVKVKTTIKPVWESMNILWDLPLAFSKEKLTK